MWNDLKSSKTFWLVVAGLLGVAQQLQSGELTRQQAVAAALALLITLTLRHAIETNGAEAPPTTSSTASSGSLQDVPPRPPTTTGPSPTRAGAILLAAGLVLSGCSSVSRQEYGALVTAARDYRAAVGPTYRASLEHLPEQSRRNRLALDEEFGLTLDSAAERAGLAPVTSER